MFSLYVHVPFCRRKCPYCDFYSVPAEEAALAAYPELLCRQLELTPRPAWPGVVDTVFFGGGTPSLLSPPAIAAVLAGIDRHFGLTAVAEITLEANPGTVTLESLAGYRAAGVNRLSLGIQSLQPEQLQRLGRIHSSRDARQAVGWARQAGFDNLSCDLMFALPGESAVALQAEIRAFLDLAPEHLSCYGLSIEEATPFYHLHRAGELPLPDDELYRQHYLELHETLQAAGYEHYEIANYARPGQQCRHNLTYWRRLPYLGIGAGAHSFAGPGWGKRLAVPRDLTRYAAVLGQNVDPSEELERFDRQGAMAETLYLGLRTAEGVCDRQFRTRFGLGVAEAFPAAVARAGQRLVRKDGCWRLDLDGWLLYDHLIASFL